MTRASKACAIDRNFAMIEAVGSLSVDEAYNARRRTGDNNGDAVGRRAELPVKLGKTLIKFDTLAAEAFASIHEMSRAVMQELLKDLRHAIDALQDHAKSLEQELGREEEIRST